MRSVLVGTSGWNYRDWRGAFYPEGMPTRLWLEHFSSSFPTVEVNSTFYGLPKEQTVRHWLEQTPRDFVFAVKVSRYLTHVKRLAETEPIDLFLERVSPLGDQLGPVLLQLPPDMPADPNRLARALQHFGNRHVALEVRHDSWFVPEVRHLLETHGAALCLADSQGELVSPDWITCSWTYIRFHGGPGHHGSYSEQRLREWATRIQSMHNVSEVYCYFNNDPQAAAIRDARRLREMLGAEAATMANPRVSSRPRER